jgi:hypothetical protein
MKSVTYGSSQGRLGLKTGLGRGGWISRDNKDLRRRGDCSHRDQELDKW